MAASNAKAMLGGALGLVRAFAMPPTGSIGG